MRSRLFSIRLREFQLKIEERPPCAFIVKIKFTTDSHFHSKLPVQTGSRSKRCSVWSEELLSEFQLRVGWDEGKDMVEGTQEKTPLQDSVGGRDPASGACQIFPKPGLLEGHDHSEKASTQECDTDRRRIRNYQIERGGHKRLSSSFYTIIYVNSSSIHSRCCQVTVQTLSFLKTSKTTCSITL